MINKTLFLTLAIMATALCLTPTTEYADVQSTITKNITSITVEAHEQESGHTFIQFNTGTTDNSFELRLDYMIKSANPDYDPGLFIRVYPEEQEMNSAWVNNRNNQECYYYTASNGELVPVLGTPTVMGRLEAYGPSGCLEEECDYYREPEGSVTIEDGKWYTKSIPVTCNVSGEMHVVLEMDKKVPGDWVEWNFDNIKVKGRPLVFSEEVKEEEPLTTDNQDVYVGPASQEQEEETTEEGVDMDTILTYTAIALGAVAVVLFFTRKGF